MKLRVIKKGQLYYVQYRFLWIWRDLRSVYRMGEYAIAFDSERHAMMYIERKQRDVQKALEEKQTTVVKEVEIKGLKPEDMWI